MENREWGIGKATDIRIPALLFPIPHSRLPASVQLLHRLVEIAANGQRKHVDGGHGGQNGLRDTLQQLGHGRFHRLRIGIGHPGHKDRVTGWVLGRAGKDDQILIDRAIDDAIGVLPLAVAGDFNEAMKRLHTSRTP